MGLFRRLFGKTKESELSYGEKRGKLKEGRSGDDAPCRGDREFVCERVEQAVAEVTASESYYYELRRNVMPQELGGDESIHPFTYGLYYNGAPRLMILILEQSWGYKKKDVMAAHELCESRGIACMNLMLHLPNRKSYIINRVRELPTY